jgi:hypothetical protein
MKHTVRSLNARGYFTGQTEARAAIAAEVRSGRMLPASAHECVDCGEAASDYDHRDYGKPLEVDPVCHPCNIKRGSAKPVSDMCERMANTVVETSTIDDLPKAFLPVEVIAQVKSYRDAVVLCWTHRRSQRMTRATLAEMTGMYAQHISDYLADSDIDRKGKERRDMPAKYIAAFESVCGNTYVSQWVANQSGLTVLEGVIAEKRAA